MFPKTQVIVNPASNRGETRRRWSQIKEAIKSIIKEFRYEFTERPLQAIEITRGAIRDGSELIIGVGGDGTMNEIANGFFEGSGIINPETTLGILPSGTGCDFTKSLHIPQGLRKALRVIAESSSRKIDVGRVVFQASTGTKEERYFLNVADFGIGGEVVREVQRRRLERKASSYLKCLISTFLQFKNKRLRLKLDDRMLPADDYMIGAVSNGRIFGKGMKIAPQAKLDDGLFDVVMIKGMRMLEFFLNSWKIYAGTHLTHPKIEMFRCRKVEASPLDSNEDVLIELDGEQPGRLPATFEVVPRHLLVKSNP